jgi:hypothetical protein
VVQAVHASEEHIGVAAAHVALVRHCTHLFVVVSQTGVAPEQSVFAAHWTHAPAAEHTVRAGSARVTHSTAVVHVAHVPAAEQIGVATWHVALDTHCGGGTSGLATSVAASGPGPPSRMMFVQPWKVAVPSQTQTFWLGSQSRPALQSLFVAQDTSSILVGRQAVERRQNNSRAFLRMART